MSSFVNIRLPGCVDSSLGSNVSLEMLQAKVSQVAEALPPLLPRAWEESKDDKYTAATVRFMQFNLLAEGLSAAPDATRPFEDALDGSEVKGSAFGGFDAVEEPERCFDFNEVRRWRLLEEVSDYTNCSLL